MFRKSAPSTTTTLWEISHQPPRGASLSPKAQWFDEYNYTVGLHDDSSFSSQLPLLVAIPDQTAQSQGELLTGKLNVYFTLDQPFAANDLRLYYGFYGTDEYQLMLDGQPLLEGLATGQGRLKQAEVAFEAISAGDHILTITVKHDCEQAHATSYLKLAAKEGAVIDLAPVLPGSDESWLTRFKTLAMALY